MSRSTIRRTLLLTVAGTVLIGLTGPPAYAAGTISANPNSGAPLSTFMVRFQNFNDCNPADPNPENCIVVDFIQGARVTTLSRPEGPNDANGSADFSSQFQVPPACSATVTTRCSVQGPATIRAHDTVGDDATTGFTVTGAATTTTAAPTTTTTKATTTTSSSTSTSTSSTSTSTSTSSTTSTTEFTTTTRRARAKKKSSDNNDDIPRYIAVGLVVAAAAATAAVDTRLRRLR